MRHYHITDSNKSYIVRRYSDYIVSRMDNLDIFNEFKNYLFKEKMEYPNDTLEDEINRLCPEILEDHFPEQVIGKGAEYAKSI
jgi:hypothetical protein